MEPVPLEQLDNECEHCGAEPHAACRPGCPNIDTFGYPEATE